LNGNKVLGVPARKTGQIEDFYSSIEVKVDNKNQAQISTINSFLDGKKPD